MLEIILVQGFCPLKITQLPDGFPVNPWNKGQQPYIHVHVHAVNVQGAAINGGPPW